MYSKGKFRPYCNPPEIASPRVQIRYSRPNCFCGMENHSMVDAKPVCVPTDAVPAALRDPGDTACPVTSVQQEN